jgi:hypothetical protein
MATESDNVNSGALGTLVAVGTIAFFGIALVVTALVRAELSEEVEKKEVSADRAYKDLVAEQQAKLNAPAAYVSRESGLVSLPIDRAMELTVEGLKKDPNSASPPPVGGSGGTGAAETGGTGGAEAGGTAAEAGGTAGAGGTGGAAPEGAKPAEGAAPAPEEKKDEKKKDEKKKDGSAKPKPAPVPASAVPAPAQAPAPIPAPVTAP